MRKPPVAPTEVQAWVQRELQAVTLEDDVKVVSQVVLRAMTLLEQSLSSQGTRYSKHRGLSDLCQKHQLLCSMTVSHATVLHCCTHHLSSISQVVSKVVKKLVLSEARPVVTKLLIR